MTIFLVIALLFYLSGAFYSIILLAMKSDQTSRALADRGPAEGAAMSRSLTPASLTPWILIGLIGAGFAAHSASILAGWMQLGYFPIINPKEVSSYIAWAIVAYFLIFSVRYHARALPAFVLPVVFVFLLASALAPGAAGEPPVILEGAITANLFTQIIFPIHVTLVIFSYAAFVVTLVCAVMYLIQERELKAKHFGGAFNRMPALNTCDEMGHRSVTFGFVLLTLGIVTGIFWNNQRDGRYWHNDPKEVLALVSWIVYLFMMHYRLTAGWRGRRFAWLSIAGFLIIMITWLGARMLGGYHVFG
jgi:cytochrome c-type biogenesis protein CcsB